MTKYIKKNYWFLRLKLRYIVMEHLWGATMKKCYDAKRAMQLNFITLTTIIFDSENLSEKERLSNFNIRLYPDCGKLSKILTILYKNTHYKKCYLGDTGLDCHASLAIVSCLVSPPPIRSGLHRRGNIVVFSPILNSQFWILNFEFPILNSQFILHIINI